MADPTTASETGNVTFNVKTSGGQKWTLTLPLTTNTVDLKEKLSGEEYANVPPSAQRLIYSGKVLKDHETLATHNVKEGTTMHLVKSAPSNQRQNPASQSSTIPNAGTPQQNTGVPQNLAAGTGNDPLAGLTGARYAGFAGLPSLDSLAHPPSPDEMLRRLQDPNFAQQMNEALQNPQMIDMMINMNPQLRAMGPQARQLLQSDHFRRMMTNPEALRSMMQLQNTMGMDPFGGMGGGGGQGAFPAPGVTNPSEQQSQTQTPSTPQPGQPNPSNPLGQQNPFALLSSMYGMPPPGSNPSGQQSLQQNPFLAMLNPGAGQQNPSQGGNTTETANREGQTQDSTQPPNPFASAMAGNPMLSQMMQDPNALQNAMNMLFGPGGAGGGGAGGAGGGLGGGFGGLGGLGGGFGGPPAPADNRPPEERFATQLRQLNEMGFYDFDRNVQALSRSGGDVNGALEWLFSQPS